MFTQIGPLEIGIVLVIALLVLGPKRLPGVGKSLGTGMREFKDSISGRDSDDKAQLLAVEAATPAPVTPVASEPRQSGVKTDA